MAEFLQAPYTSGETSDDGPALAVVGGQIFIAWVGSGNRHLNIAPVVENGGRFEIDSSRKRIIERSLVGDEVSSNGGPALCASEGGELVLAWTHYGGGLLGPGSAEHILGMTFGMDLTPREMVGSLETSDHGPALAFWNNGANIAWTGGGNRNLNVTQKRVITDEFGSTLQFSFNDVSTSPHTSPYRPALTTSLWPNFSLYLVWTGEGDGQLNYLWVNDTNPFVGAGYTPSVIDGAQVETIPGETTTAGPAAAALGHGLYLAWRGTDNEQLNLLGIDLGQGSRYKYDPSERTTPYHPAMIAYGERLVVAWTGNDDALNTAWAAPIYPASS